MKNAVVPYSAGESSFDWLPEEMLHELAVRAFCCGGGVCCGNGRPGAPIPEVRDSQIGKEGSAKGAPGGDGPVFCRFRLWMRLSRPVEAEHPIPFL